MSIEYEKYNQLYKQAISLIYSDVVIDHGQNPRNLGITPKSNAFGIIFGPCGDMMAVWLNIEDDKITDISFTTDGCMTSLAAGSMATELAMGKNINDALQINQKDILDALCGLPDESEHCALLASNTLKEALNDYLAFKEKNFESLD